MKKVAIIMAASAFLFFAGCKKDAGSSAVSFQMKDAPAVYDKVLVEVTGVEINSSAKGWVSVPVQDSIYDLLLLQGGNANAVLGNAMIPAGDVSQIRLILGTQNSVVIAGISFQLALSSEDETGLKLNIHQTLIANTPYTLVIDFNASQSIVVEGNSTYRLKPVLTASL